MSIATGPSPINNGLVFAFDSANSRKSWQGKPTTNFISNPTEVIVTGEFGQYRDLAPTFNANGLVPHSLSMDMKVNKPGSVLVYMQNGSSTKYGFVYQSVNATTEYQRFYFDNITPAISTPSDTAATLATYTTYGSGVIPTVKNIQLELGTFSTPFVNGSRSNTQAVLDLTGKNTITTTSLTYTSDGQFIFDGNSNYIRGTSNCGITGSVTLSAIIKPSYSGQTGPHSTILCTDVNYPNGAKLMNYKNTTRYGLWLGFGGVDNYEAFVGTDINNNTIKMLTASWDQGTGIVNIYLNGVLQSSQSTGKTIPTVLADGLITLGTDYNSIGSAAKNKFLGNIYYASIHNRVLSPGEVAQQFNSTRSRYGL